uniref:Uncharacterized protein n=1 Tax=Steinernema glaseri TaxID=37863 RepID=A0A1I7ZA58_9BILA
MHTTRPPLCFRRFRKARLEAQHRNVIRLPIVNTVDTAWHITCTGSRSSWRVMLMKTLLVFTNISPQLTLSS